MTCDKPTGTPDKGHAKTAECNFRSLADHLPDNVARWDREGRYLYINPTHEECIGMACSRVAGRRIGEAFPDGRFAAVEAAVDHVVATGMPVSFLRQLVPVANGETRIHDINLVPEFDEGGGIASVLGIGRDMTETYRLHEIVAAREQEFRSLAECSPDAIVRFDREGRIRYVNAILVRALGFAHANDVIGKHPAELWPDGCFAMVDQAAEQAVATEIQQTIEFSTVMTDPSGQAKTRQVVVVPERDAAGHVIGTLAFGRDITERKALDAQLAKERSLLEQRIEDRTRELKASQEKLQTLINDIGSQFVIYSHKPDGELLYVSDGIATVLGCSRADAVTRTLTNLVDWLPGSMEHVAITIDRLVAGILESAQGELAFRHPDGGVRMLQVSAHAVRDFAGNVVSIDGIAEDITARKKVEKELNQAKEEAEAANRAKSQFLAAASHDLRQPIQAIGLFLGVLGKTAITAEQRNVHDHLTTTAALLGGMLDSLLDISRLDAGVITPKSAPLQVMDIMAKLDSECSPLAQASQLRFKLFFPARPVVFAADPHLLLAMLRNIVGNAIRYTPEGGVLIGVRIRRNRLVFEVWDTGVGIAKDDLPHIFDEFVQLGNPQRDRARGLGLGLAIVKRLAALTGYSVTCRSRIGRGSVFGIDIPLADPADDRNAPPLQPSLDDSDEPISLAGLKLALIEDDQLVAQALAGWLRAHRIDVECYADGAAALASPSIVDADAYISDFRLPGQMTGADLLEAIAQRAGGPIAGIIITGDTAVDRISALAETPWPVFHKPLAPGQLVSAIARLHGNRRAARTDFSSQI